MPGPHAPRCLGAQYLAGRTYVTLSIGVACLLPDPSLDPASMVNAADAAMYRAKTSGRARYEVADQADWDIDKDTPRTRPSPLS